MAGISNQRPRAFIAERLRTRVVWADLRCMPSQRGLAADAPAGCALARVTRPLELASMIAREHPHFVCIEYDYPDRARLDSVVRARREFPALPILMLTEYHTEALAVWAFRHRVWDYRVKPVTRDTLARLFVALADAAMTAPATVRGWHAPPLPAELCAPAGHLSRPLTTSTRTAAAVAWVGAHYAQPCPVREMADLCHLSESEFSRAFHHENGDSFCHFLLGYRITMARCFLGEPGATVSQVAYAVGFNDLSYFGRVFRRFVGVPATHYQARHAGQAPQPAQRERVAAG